MRRAAKPGLSYVDANRGRIVEFEDDVLGIKKEILSRWAGRLDCFWDKESMEWVVVEHCSDGVDRLVFTETALDQRVIDRLHRADTHAKGQEDPDALVDAYNAEV